MDMQENEQMYMTCPYIQYKAIWEQVYGEELGTERETENANDLLAIAVVKSLHGERTVRHSPCRIFPLF